MDESGMADNGAAQGRAWRPMTDADLADVDRIGTLVHPDYPEAIAVLAEKLRLFPGGCFVLDGPVELQGYAFAHPWRIGAAPALDTMLGQLPPSAETLHIHDVALLPEVRGSGAGGAIVSRLTAVAAATGLPTLSLVAVGTTMPFWRHHRFAVAIAPLPSYGPEARYMVRYG